MSDSKSKLQMRERERERESGCVGFVRLCVCMLWRSAVYVIKPS